MEVDGSDDFPLQNQMPQKISKKTAYSSVMLRTFIGAWEKWVIFGFPPLIFRGVSVAG